MNIDGKKMLISQEDLQEIFCLFTSPTKHEKQQIYDRNSTHYFGNTDLTAEYTLSEEKREYALDAWRAVLSFLHRKGYTIAHEGKSVDLAWINEEFIG